MLGYALGEVLQAHSDDVKCVIAVDQRTLLSASRDNTVGVWRSGGEGGHTHRLQRILQGHLGYVNSLEVIPSEDGYPALIASAGNSSLILLHELDPLYPTSDPLTALTGHYANVCALSYSGKRRKLISASWDCAARIWTRVRGQGPSGKDVAGKWDCEKVLSGHSAAVWGVAIFEEGPREGCYITGSADRLIKLWSPEGVLINDFPVQPDCVRSLAVFPGGNAFAAALNDGTVRILDTDGSTLSVLRGHGDYVYHVAVDGTDGTLLSCGEDHTVRVWRDGQLVDTILHPCQTVWCATFIPDSGMDGTGSDIASAGSDNVVRIWTRNQSRLADEAVRATHDLEVEEAMKNYEAQKSVVVAETDTSCPHVLDIDIEDDKPPLQLRFGDHSDPAETAEAFGRQHGLSDRYISQIKEFLEAHLSARRC